MTMPDNAAMSGGLLSGWQFDASIWGIALGIVVLYGAGIVAYDRRRPGRHWPAVRTLFFLLGVGTVVIALQSPVDTFADDSFAMHMIQHLLLTDVCPPLLLLGAPLILIVAAPPQAIGKRISLVMRSAPVKFVTSPPFAWCAFVGTLWGIHYTPLFGLALENDGIHEFMHVLFLSSALLFWIPIVAEPAFSTGRAFTYPLRLLYVFGAMLAEIALGYSISSAPAVLYAHYAGSAHLFGMNALADQQAAGQILCVGGALLMFAALIFIGAQWARESDLEALRSDALRGQTVE